MKGGQLFKYEKERDARIAVIPRYGDVDSIKWFHIERCVTYHIMNSFEDGDEVFVRGCKANESILPGPDWGEDKLDWFSRGFNFKLVDSKNGKKGKETGDGMLFTSVREWRLNLETLEVKDRDVTGTEYSMDFPIINADFTGLKHQYGYTQVIDSLASSKAGSAFVAKPEAIEEDGGWIVTFAHDEDSDTSYVLVVDAKNFGSEPIAKINLPQRVPYGFHGSFFSST
ncbi:hypothetical protein L2E82_41921 [Cichorium intybus]|uniref:Uncharacterized protein n=1 Tax=Cichorium intybus TaxID=13427 RepID=A0ACB8ZMC8_CICIN|nr:hypothetical protein L2E82_41921 [Cichorium intybus]